MTRHSGTAAPLANSATTDRQFSTASQSLNFANAWVISSVELITAVIIGTFDVKAKALVDLVRGRRAHAMRAGR